MRKQLMTLFVVVPPLVMLSIVPPANAVTRVAKQQGAHRLSRDECVNLARYDRRFRTALAGQAAARRCIQSGKYE